MLTRRNFWILSIGTALLVAVFWFGAYRRDYRADLPGEVAAFPSGLVGVTGTGTLTDSFFADHITVLAFATLSCPNNCQTSFVQMNKLQKLMNGFTEFQALTVGVGFRGQLQLLTSLVQRMRIDGPRWTFAAESDQAEPLISRLNKTVGQDFKNTVSLSSIVLVDRRGMIRGVYAVDDKFAVVKLQNDVFHLLKTPTESVKISQRDNKI